jgi:hypothetical protein
MSISEALGQLFLGILLGALGQGLRVLVGLKKGQDSAAAKGQSFTESDFDGVRLGVSLFIGGIVGGLTELVLAGFKPLGTVDENLIFKLIAVGYAGTDAIEGLLQKFIPGSSTGANATPAPAIATPVAGVSPLGRFRSSLPIAAARVATTAAALESTPAPSAKDSATSLQIQLDVAVKVFPACAVQAPGGRLTVDTNFSISAECSADPDNVALDINTFASTLAQINALKWSVVVAADASGLKAIKDLMGLVDKHLS